MSFYQTCMGICIGVIIFGLCVNFVNITGVFPMSYGNQITQGTNTSNSIGSITKGYDFNWVWGVFMIAGMLLTLPILILTHSVNILGAYLFGLIFWGSYTGAVAVLLGGGFLGGVIMVAFTGIFTIIIGLIFIGAVIGMFTGSG